MEIKKPNQQKAEWDQLQSSQEAGAADAASVVLGINRKKVKVRRSKIRDIAQGLAEIAYSMGETNDPETFAEEMTDDIMAGIREAQKRRQQKKKA